MSPFDMVDRLVSEGEIKESAAKLIVDMLAKWNRKYYFGLSQQLSEKDVEIKPTSFFLYMLEMYSPVEFIEDSKVRNGMAGVEQDRARLKSYFSKDQDQINA